MQNVILYLLGCTVEDRSFNVLMKTDLERIAHSEHRY